MASALMAAGGWFMVAACHTPGPPSAPTMTIEIEAHITPQSVEAVPGETRTFRAAVTYFDKVFAESWRTTSSVLSIQNTTPTGFGSGGAATVKCQGVGIGTVTYTASVPPDGRPSWTDTAVMTCRDPVTLTPPPVVEHTVGKSPCPQPLGNIAMRNTTEHLITVTARSDNSAIEISPVVAGLGAMGEQSFGLKFNCATVPPIKATIVFTVVIEGVTLTYQSEVTVNAGK